MSVDCLCSAPSFNLEADALDDEEAAGYLSKMIGDTKVNRFVVLKDNTLLYYENSDRVILKDLNRVTNSRVSTSSKKRQGKTRIHELRIEHNVLPTIVLLAPSKLSLKLWAKAIEWIVLQSTACEGYYETVSKTVHSWQDPPIQWEVQYYLYLNGQFSSYSKASDSQPRYSIDISECDVTFLTVDDRFCVELIPIGSDSRKSAESVVRAFKTETDRSQWIRSLGLHEPKKLACGVKEKLSNPEEVTSSQEVTKETPSRSKLDNDSEHTSKPAKQGIVSPLQSTNETGNGDICLTNNPEDGKGVEVLRAPSLQRAESLVGKHCLVRDRDIGVVLQYHPGHNKSYDVKMLDSGKIETVNSEELTESKLHLSIPDERFLPSKVEAPKTLTMIMKKKNRFGQWQQRIVTIGEPGVITISHDEHSKSKYQKSAVGENNSSILDIFHYTVSIGRKNELVLTAVLESQKMKEYRLRIESADRADEWLSVYNQWKEFKSQKIPNDSSNTQ